MQRITAVLKFLDNELTIFEGYHYKDFDDTLNTVGFAFKLHVNNLRTRQEVLKWYVAINSCGVIHSKEEIERVQQLIKEENKRV